MLVLENILSLYDILIQKQQTASKLYTKHWITSGLNLTSPEYDLNTELMTQSWLVFGLPFGHG